MPNGLALLTVGPAQIAIVFVHGFAGSADGTWERFSRGIRRMNEGAAADAFFLEYPSTTTPVPFCASKVRPFLLDLLREPAIQIVNGSLPDGAPRRPPGVSYNRILLVGHSMGAVVARRALLDLDLGNHLRDEDRAKIQMLFFAPAHKGARNLSGLIASGLGLDRIPGGSAVGLLLRLRYRSVDDLIKENDCLVDLAADSISARTSRETAKADVSYLRAQVVHAHKDFVVYQDSFDRDFPFEGVMGQNHRSVCKPREGYLDPEDYVRRLLQ